MVECPKGEIVFRQGQPCEAIYFILSGRCGSHREGNGFGHHGAGQVFGPGDTLGERELLNREPYRATVTVLTDSILLRIPGEEMEHLFKDNPALAGRFSRTITTRQGTAGFGEGAGSVKVKRIVSLLSLSRALDDVTVSRRLAGELAAFGDARVLLVHGVISREPISLDGWPLIEAAVNGKFTFADQLQRTEQGYDELRLSIRGGPEERSSIAPILSHLGAHFDYVLLHLSQEVACSASIECMVQSDLTYVILHPAPENLYQFRLLITELCAGTKGDCSHIKPILCLDDRGTPADFTADLEKIGRPIHSFVRGYPLRGNGDTVIGSGNFGFHMRSLAREIAGRRVGLALSSGGAKGLAHIGVLQVLEENGIEVDLVAGTSMGAYVAAVWAAGYDGRACEAIARQSEGRWGLIRLLDPVLPPRKGFLRSRRIVRRLKSSIGDIRFSGLERPLRVVATALDTLERVVFSSGEVARAVEASIAIPGICVPVTIDGEALVDGGIVDPLPVDVLREMGIEYVIAVNTIPNPAEMRLHGETFHESKPVSSRMRRLRHFLNERLNYFARGNILDTLMRSMDGVQMRIAEASCLDADVVLRPWTCEGRWHDFGHPGKYIELGRKAALEQLPRLKALVKGTAYVSQPAPKRVAIAA